MDDLPLITVPAGSTIDIDDGDLIIALPDGRKKRLTLLNENGVIRTVERVPEDTVDTTHKHWLKK